MDKKKCFIDKCEHVPVQHLENDHSIHIIINY